MQHEEHQSYLIVSYLQFSEKQNIEAKWIKNTRAGALFLPHAFIDLLYLIHHNH